jgi:uncharacterized protein (DUF433 family)
MNWRGHIQADPEIVAGKPALQGTRLSVELLRGLLRAGWSQEQVLKDYPSLTPMVLRAVSPDMASGSLPN